MRSHSYYYRNLLGYLPEYLREILELRQIMEAEQPEFERLYEAIISAGDDLFLSTLSINGIRRWEKIFGIAHDESMRLEDRRARILMLYLIQTPYTYRTLEAYLNNLSDSVDIDLRNLKYQIFIRIRLGSLLQRTWLTPILREMIPANMDIRLTVALAQSVQQAKTIVVTASRRLVTHAYSITGGTHGLI